MGLLSEGTEACATSVLSGDLVPLEFRFEKNQREPGDPFESPPSMAGLACLEICAGGGGQSLGLHQAGFAHVAAVEIDLDACETLRLNHKEWNIVERDIHHFDGTSYKGVDLLAGGVPCPPFSIAGKQLGADDERSRAAIMLDMDGKLGIVAPGAFADIIAVSGDPLQDIKALGSVQFVMKDGKVFKSEGSQETKR